MRNVPEMMAGTDPSEEDPSHLGERKRVGAETGMSIETGIGMTTAMTVIAVGVDLGHGRLAEMQRKLLEVGTSRFQGI